MKKRRDAAVIGAFVVGGLALVVAAVLVLGSGRLFRERAKFIAYFEGSVEGLEAGAPVKVRGVTVGRVVRIQLRYRQREDDNRIPVFMDVDVKRLAGLGYALPGPEMIGQLIRRGLRARLESQSLVTGTLFVNVATFPGTPLHFSELDSAHGYPEIPTIPNQLAQLGQSATAVVARLQELDLPGMVRSIDRAAVSLADLVGSRDVMDVLTGAHATLDAYRRLARHVDGGVQPALAEVQATVGEARRTLLGVDKAAGAAGRLMAPEASLSVRLSEALSEVGRAASSVRELAEYLQRNPNSLLVGKAR